MTTKMFFEDLENRGPLHPNSFFEKWTKKIRKDMEKSGTWLAEDGDEIQILKFVVEYMSRLQKEFWYACSKSPLKTDMIMIARTGQFPEFNSQKRIFRLVYFKIRAFGLRMKKFGLCSWQKDVMLVTYIRKFDLDNPYYGNTLYSYWQCWCYLVGTKQSDFVFRIDPFELTIPWISSREPSWRYDRPLSK